MGVIGDRGIFVKLLLTALLFVVWGAEVDAWKVDGCKTSRTCNT